MGENLLPFFFKRIVSNRINFVLRLLPVNNHKLRDHKDDEGGEDWPSSTRFMVPYGRFEQQILFEKIRFVGLIDYALKICMDQ